MKMHRANTFYMWQNGMCITYLTVFKQMEQFLTANGWQISQIPEKADYVIIGACASFLPYFDSYAEKTKNIYKDRQKLVVYGCLPKVNPDFYQKKTPETALFIPIRQPEKIEALIENLKFKWKDIPVSSEFRREDYVNYNPKRSFIIIQEGCSEGCIYCPHKMAIGKETSRTREEIMTQVIRDISKGAEIILLEGENLGTWGRDLNPRQDFADLLREILQKTSHCEIHVSNLSPKWIHPYLEVLIHPRITDIKIPIQSVSPGLLKRMGRSPLVKEIGPALKKLKEANPKLVLRTEIIIGLPTSTREELRQTLEFVGHHFDKVACFSFDFFPHSQLAEMKLPLIQDNEIAERIKIAMNYFKTRPSIKAAFDDRGKIMAQITNASNE